jgi:hypothetical protein
MPTLTPAIAKDLIQRSMTTGAPTSEFNSYGGYAAVKAMYDANGGTTSRDEISAADLKNYANIVANTGVGELGILRDTNTPLTEAGRTAMKNNGVEWTDEFLKEIGIPYVGFLPKTTSPINTGTGIGVSNGINTGVAGSSNLNYSPGVFGVNSGERMGAGNATYQSDLIKSLRQSDNDFENSNSGFTNYGYTPPSTSGANNLSLNAGGAFNPNVLTQDAASADDVANWNNYSTYRTNALNAKTPIDSFSKWLSGGKVSGIPAAVTE